jgi:inosine-uridine nucleoside N-ribohydrolase
VKRKVIVDQDTFGPGGSNLQSILLLLQAPDVEVLGITVVTGDGWLRENVAHALRFLELVGRPDIPVVPGAEFPLVNTEERTAAWESRYGALPYKGAWMRTWPDYNTVERTPYHAPAVVPPSPAGPPTVAPAAEDAATFLVRQVRAHPGEITILAMGPFTNLARAATLDPAFGALARELVFMGAAFNPIAPAVDEFSLQFIHSPRVEFNCRFDPEGAARMLRAGWKKITCVPLDATVRTQLTPALLARATAGAADPRVSDFLTRFAAPGYPMWDEVAAALWLDPSLAARTTRLAMDIATDPGAGYGMTLSWPPGRGPGHGEPDADVVLDLDVPRFETLFATLLLR